MTLAQPDGGQSTQRYRYQRRDGRNNDRILERSLPFVIGKEISVMFKRLPVWIQSQHFWGKCEKILRIKRQGHHDHNRRDQEKED